MGRFVVAIALACSAALLACSPQRVERVPGETDTPVAEVRITAPGGGELELAHEPLISRLGLRVPSLIVPGRTFNPYRLAEDRRRLAAYWETYGYFDVTVDPPVVRTDEKRAVHVAWTVHEGVRYTIGEVHVEHAPDDTEPEITSLVPFAAGERNVDLESMRHVRSKLSDRLRRKGYGHAEVYSRTYVDRTNKTLAWYYLVDAGPKTRVGKIIVVGNKKVPSDVVIARTGFSPGDPYDLATKEKAETDLLDTGAFASIYIRSNADNEFIAPGTVPDSGGALKPEQVGPDGELVPRKLNPNVDLTVVVVEAPSARLRVKAGFEIDPSRADTTIGAELVLRNALGPQQHLTFDGHLGYGVLFDARGEPSGLYGEALIRYDHPGLFARLFDARVTARYRDVLYPGFHLRELTVGPGMRSTLAPGLFLDVDAFFRLGQDVDFGPFDAATRTAFSIPDNDLSKGALVDAALTWDARNDKIEPTSGAFAAFRSELSPGGPLGTNRWAELSPELRAFLPLTHSLSLAAKASGGFVVWKGAEGVPLGPRLFGGGAFGMRGYGLYELSPLAPCSVGPTAPNGCLTLPAGGLSLVETSLEARFLPEQKPYGATVFADLGGAGRDLDPFRDGPSFAAGLGLRLRLWYLPMAFDFAYRVVDRGELTRAADVPILVFFRVGEAF